MKTTKHALTLLSRTVDPLLVDQAWTPTVHSTTRPQVAMAVHRPQSAERCNTLIHTQPFVRT